MYVKIIYCNIYIINYAYKYVYNVTFLQKITQDMLLEAQLEFFREQTLTTKRKRALMAQEVYYIAMKKAVKRQGLSENYVKES